MFNLIFFIKKERWGLTFAGFVVFLTAGTGGFILSVLTVYDFLAVCEPAKAEILVVEGWVPDQVVQRAVKEFQRNDYKVIVCIGGPIQTGSYLYPFNNFAELTYHRLINCGVIDSKIVVIATEDVRKDRTFQGALAFKKWMDSCAVSTKGINIFTLGVHARRSRLLFQKALGEDILVGVVGVPDERFETKAWWKSSNGVRVVVDEIIAYLYARSGS